MPLTRGGGYLAQNPGMCPDWESNQQPFGLQARAQSAELHQPGKHLIFEKVTLEQKGRILLLLLFF